MTTQRASLSPANIHWLDDGSPFSNDFNDIYFAPEKGVAESDYVYLKGNRLAERFAAVSDQFAIAEAGFGSGLNFLLTLQLWRKSRYQEQHGFLHYYSAENHPLKLDDLARALEAFPELKANADTLLENYPPMVAGFYTVDFAPNVQLHLLFGSAESVFGQLRDSDRQMYCRKGIDAWFLDGFAPSKNPAMWSDVLLEAVSGLSHTGTTFSTFSAAGSLRRALQAQGFQVRKQTGFGAKREMLQGEFVGPHGNNRYKRNKLFPAASWYIRSPSVYEHIQDKRSTSVSVAIVGAGLAGCLTAAALAKRGLRVDVYDRGDGPATGASAVPHAALYTRLSHFSSSANNFALQAYLFATQLYDSLVDTETAGLLELQMTAEAQQHAFALAQHLHRDDVVQFLTTAQASAMAGVALMHPALYYPRGRSINPATLCQRLIDGSTRITLHKRTEVGALEKYGAHWQLKERPNGETIGSADCVIVCGGPDSKRFEQLSWLPTRVIRGQTALLRASEGSNKLQTVLCAESYLTPAVNGLHCAGSSYVLDSESTAIDTAEHRNNVANAAMLLPELNDQMTSPEQAWAGLRCTSPDYLPLVGPVPQITEFEQQFAKLQHDKNAPLALRPAMLPGLFANVAMGSRGLCFAPLCAELIASQLCEELSPLPAPLRHALLPARFIVRNISRGVFASNKNCA